MGLYKTIKENNIYIAMHRSTPKDAYLYFDLSEAITHSEKILRGISETIPNVTCMDDLLNYFAIKRIESFAESLTTITDKANRETIQKLANAAGEVAKKYSTGIKARKQCSFSTSNLWFCKWKTAKSGRVLTNRRDAV